MASSEVELIGTGAVAKTIARIAAAMPEAAKRALRTEAELIRRHSMRLTPVDTGALRGSHVVTTKQTLEGPEAEVGVGGPAAPYAISVHEIPMRRHNPPTQWKFLETAANHAIDTGMHLRIGKRLVASMRKARGF